MCKIAVWGFSFFLETAICHSNAILRSRGLRCEAKSGNKRKLVRNTANFNLELSQHAKVPMSEELPFGMRVQNCRFGFLFLETAIPEQK